MSGAGQRSAVSGQRGRTGAALGVVVSVAIAASVSVCASRQADSVHDSSRRAAFDICSRDATFAARAVAEDRSALTRVATPSANAFFAPPELAATIRARELGSAAHDATWSASWLATREACVTATAP